MDTSQPFNINDFYKNLTNICEALVWEKPIDESKLFTLTKQDIAPKEITRLAEAFGMMLVKIEARELQQAQLINELCIRNSELEAAKKMLAEKNITLTKTIQENYQSQKIIGQCPAMHKVLELAKSIARNPINTLILGPTGSGKEIIAKMIHYSSPRSSGPFIAVNCTAIPETLFESEMFGIEKGIATGVHSRKGLIEEADGGTLFLDELADMSLPNQAKLLRVLEEKAVVKVGSSKLIPVDIKIIAATHASLLDSVKKGIFREDLYYRINVVEINIPPLSQRGDDILLLAQTFLKRHCELLQRNKLILSPAVQQKLLTYSWPGNVRELNNEMERLAALTLGNTIEINDLSPRLLNDGEFINKDTSDPTLIIENLHKNNEQEQYTLNLQEMERSLILKALKQTGGNKSRTAEILGITREGLRKKLIRLDITTT